MSLTGMYVPLITPFDADGSVALRDLEALAHQVLDDGAAGVVALGTTAEPASLSAQERRAVIDVTARVCRERSAPLLVGANDRHAIQALRDHPEVVAALSVVPPFVRPGPKGVLAHFAQLIVLCRILGRAGPVPAGSRHGHDAGTAGTGPPVTGWVRP